MEQQLLTKKELRKTILALRRNLTAEEAAGRSRIICGRVAEQNIFRECHNICLYMPVNNEVDVTLLFDAAWSQGKSVWLPRVSGSEMQFCAYDRSTPVLVGPYHIKEPDSFVRLVPDDRTLIIMPGAVFSEKRDRIGYGGGYYDRYLEQNPMCHSIAVCYDFQIVKNVPAEAHDRKPELVVSDRNQI